LIHPWRSASPPRQAGWAITGPGPKPAPGALIGGTRSNMSAPKWYLPALERFLRGLERFRRGLARFGRGLERLWRGLGRRQRGPDLAQRGSGWRRRGLRCCHRGQGRHCDAGQRRLASRLTREWMIVMGERRGCAPTLE